MTTQTDPTPHLSRKLAILAHTNPQLFAQITGGKKP